MYLLISQVFNIKSSQADSVLMGQLWLFFLYYSIILYTRVSLLVQVFWSYNKKGVQPFELTCLCKMYTNELHVNKCSSSNPASVVTLENCYRMTIQFSLSGLFVTLVR